MAEWKGNGLLHGYTVGHGEEVVSGEARVCFALWMMSPISDAGSTR